MSTPIPSAIRRRVLACARAVTEDCSDVVALLASSRVLTDWLSEALDEPDLYLRAASLDDYLTCLSVTPPAARLTPPEFLRGGQALHAFFITDEAPFLITDEAA